MSARLVVQLPGGQRHDFPIRSPSLTVRRAQSSDLVLDYSYVSRSHARLERTRDGYLLTDCGSMNGTYVNGPGSERRSSSPPATRSASATRR